MESFKQILGYVKNDFDIKEEIEINMKFIKDFHKEFNKYQEQMQNRDLSFLENTENVEINTEEKSENLGFVSITPISKWFKENKNHENYNLCLNNLYSLLCISQDIIGNEMLKGFQDINPENMGDYIKNMLGDDSPLKDMLDNSPLGGLLKNGELKGMVENVMNKMKDLDIEGLMKKFNDGNLDLSNLPVLLNDLGLSELLGKNGKGIGSIMNLLTGFMDSGNSEMAGMSPQQRAKYRREKKRIEMRRKVRAREKAKKAKRNRKRRN